MAKSDTTKEPSYTTLANLAEILGTAIYQSPALASSNKLDEATVPTSPKIDMGIIVGLVEVGQYTKYNVRLNSGAQVIADTLTGNHYHEGYAVCVAQDTSGNYVILSGGDADNKTKYGNEIMQEAMAYSMTITGRDRELVNGNTFRAFDTDSLIRVVNSLVIWVQHLQDCYNVHTHAVADGVASATPLQSTDNTSLNDDKRDYINSHTNKYEIIY